MVGDRVMTLRGETTVIHKEPVETRRAIDRHYGRSACSFRRPADAEPQKVKTALRDGLLDMGVPRRQSRPAVKKRIPTSRGQSEHTATAICDMPFRPDGAAGSFYSCVNLNYV